MRVTVDAQQVGRDILVGRKAGQPAVEVNVGGVDEFQIELPVMASHSSQLVQSTLFDENLSSKCLTLDQYSRLPDVVTLE